MKCAMQNVQKGRFYEASPSCWGRPNIRDANRKVEEAAVPG